MIDDMFTQLRDTHGNLTGLTRPVTPAEISAAHPKCESCGHREETHWKSFPTRTQCGNKKSKYYHLGGGVDPESDYCRWHSELTKGQQDDKG